MPDSATLWTVAVQAPLSIRFFRQEYWSGLSCPPPGDLPDPRVKSASLKSPAPAGRFLINNAAWEALCDASVLFYFSVIFHYMAKLQIVYQWTYGILPVWGYHKWSFYNHSCIVLLEDVCVYCSWVYTWKWDFCT